MDGWRVATSKSNNGRWKQRRSTKSGGVEAHIPRVWLLAACDAPHSTLISQNNLANFAKFTENSILTLKAIQRQEEKGGRGSHSGNGWWTAHSGGLLSGIQQKCHSH